MRIDINKKLSWTVKPLLWLQKKHYGKVLNPGLIWGRKPVLFLSIATFLGFLERKKAPVDPKMRSLVCVRVSQLNGCAFCLDVNSMRLAERSGNLDQVKELANWKTSSLFSDLEKLVLEYVEALTITGENVSNELIEQLKQEYSEDALIELTALISFQNLSAKFNNALDIPEQGFCSILSSKQD